MRDTKRKTAPFSIAWWSGLVGLLTSARVASRWLLQVSLVGRGPGEIMASLKARTELSTPFLDISCWLDGCLVASQL